MSNVKHAHIEVVVGWEFETVEMDRGVVENNPELSGQMIKVPTRTIRHAETKEICEVHLDVDSNKNVLLGNAILALKAAGYPNNCEVSAISDYSTVRYYGYPSEFNEEDTRQFKISSAHLLAVMDEVRTNNVRIRYTDNQLTVDWDFKDGEYHEGNTYFMVGENIHTMDPDYQKACEYITSFRSAVIDYQKDK